MKRKERIIISVQYKTTIPKTCSDNTRKSTPKTWQTSRGQTKLSTGCFEFDNGIDKIPDLQKIHTKKQGLEMIGKCQHPRSSIWFTGSLVPLRDGPFNNTV